jgi:hypothetical protein
MKPADRSDTVSGAAPSRTLSTSPANETCPRPLRSAPWLDTKTTRWIPLSRMAWAAFRASPSV